MRRHHHLARIIQGLTLAAPLAVRAEEAPGVFRFPGSGTTLKVSCSVQLDTTYDLDGADDNIRGDDWASFLPFQPLDQGQRDRSRLYVTARTSRLGLTTTTPTAAGDVVVRLEGDFNSPSAYNYSTEATTNGTNFRVRHAYGELGGVLVGQSWANFIDLGSLPDTVDFNPHGAFALLRSPGVRYTVKLGGPTLAVALENPQSVVVNSEVSQSYTVGREYDRLPDASASFTVPHSLGHLNLRAVVHEYQGRTAAGARDSALGWGGGVSGSLNVGDESLVWSVQGGDGIGRYLFQTLFQGAAFVGDQIKTWKAGAYHLGLTHRWSPALRSNLVWTQTFVQKDDALAAAAAASPFGTSAANKRIDAAYLNTFCSPAQGVEVGLEYAWGRRTVFAAALADPASDVGTQHRVNASVRYSLL